MSTLPIQHLLNVCPSSASSLFVPTQAFSSTQGHGYIISVSLSLQHSDSPTHCFCRDHTVCGCFSLYEQRRTSPTSSCIYPSTSILYNFPKVKLALVSCKLPLGGFGFGQWLILHSSWCSRKQNSDSRGLRSAHHPDASTPIQKANGSTCKFISSSCGLLALQPQIALFHHH